MHYAVADITFYLGNDISGASTNQSVAFIINVGQCNYNAMVIALTDWSVCRTFALFNPDENICAREGGGSYRQRRLKWARTGGVQS